LRIVTESLAGLTKGRGLPVIVVGVVGGLVGAAYLAVLQLLQRLLAPEHHGSIATFVILVAVGASVTLINRTLGESGNVELLVDNIHVLGRVDDARRLVPLIPASLLCVSAGGAMGPEAPLVQTTGTLGTSVSRRLRRRPTDVRVLTITGMAAGFAVLFGAPLGAALFALEILHRRGLQYYEALLPALVGSLCGYAMFVVLTGLGLEPVWEFPDVGPRSVQDLLIAVAVAGIGSVGALVFAFVVKGARALFATVPTWARPVLGGVVLGLLGMWSPYALTFGESQLGDLLDTRLGVGALAVALVAKLLGTTTTLASEWKGGFIIPLFFIGAVAGQIIHHWAPDVNESVLMATMMTALCVGVTKTPLGTTLVVTEMAGLPMLPATLVAAVVALLVTGPVSVIESQRARDTDAAAEP
jgi:H+/Cl- antiporter ClcA